MFDTKHELKDAEERFWMGARKIFSVFWLIFLIFFVSVLILGSGFELVALLFLIMFGITFFVSMLGLSLWFFVLTSHWWFNDE